MQEKRFHLLSLEFDFVTVLCLLLKCYAETAWVSIRF